jgi:hypothetical protein
MLGRLLAEFGIEGRSERLAIVRARRLAREARIGIEVGAA